MQLRQLPQRRKMSILAGVLLIHQPIYILTQYLIAVGRQRSIAIVSIARDAPHPGVKPLFFQSRLIRTRP